MQFRTAFLKFKNLEILGFFFPPIPPSSRPTTLSWLALCELIWLTVEMHSHWLIWTFFPPLHGLQFSIRANRSCASEQSQELKISVFLNYCSISAFPSLAKGQPWHWHHALLASGQSRCHPALTQHKCLCEKCPFQLQLAFLKAGWWRSRGWWEVNGQVPKCSPEALMEVCSIQVYRLSLAGLRAGILDE